MMWGSHIPRVKFWNRNGVHGMKKIRWNAPDCAIPESMMQES